MICYNSINTYSQKGYRFANLKPDATDTFNGHVFDCAYGSKFYKLTDSRIPAKEQWRREMIVDHYIPVKLNGRKVHYDFKKPPKTKSGDLFSKYIFDSIQSYLPKLLTGNYVLSLPAIVFDEKGKAIYFDTIYSCEIQTRQLVELDRIPVPLYRSMKTRLMTLLKKIEMKPVKRNGKYVPFGLLCPFITTIIYVENGKVTYY